MAHRYSIQIEYKDDVDFNKKGVEAIISCDQYCASDPNFFIAYGGNNGAWYIPWHNILRLGIFNKWPDQKETDFTSLD